jgi:hypothetical protein
MKISAVCLIGVAFLASPVFADLYLYNDSLKWSEGGLYATGTWASTTTEIAWTVEESTVDPALWHYEYTFTVPVKALSHIVIEVSETFKSDDFVNLVTEGLNGPYLLLWKAGTSGNEYLPVDLYGLKFEGFDSAATSWTIAFDTRRAPMWGNFYAKDGAIKDWTTNPPTNVPIYAYNTDIRMNPDDFDRYAEYTDTFHMAVPDTRVPVPAAVLLGMLGLGAAGLKLRRFV